MNDVCCMIKPLCRELNVSYMIDKMECLYGVYFLYKYKTNIVSYPSPCDKVNCNRGSLACEDCSEQFISNGLCCRKDIYDFLE